MRFTYHSFIEINQIINYPLVRFSHTQLILTSRLLFKTKEYIRLNEILYICKVGWLSSISVILLVRVIVFMWVYWPWVYGCECMCLNVSVCVCVWVHIYECMVWVYVLECMGVSACMWMYGGECMRTFVCIWVYGCDCMYVIVCVWVYVFEWMHVCVHVLECMPVSVYALVRAFIKNIYNQAWRCPFQGWKTLKTKQTKNEHKNKIKTRNLYQFIPPSLPPSSPPLCVTMEYIIVDRFLLLIHPPPNLYYLLPFDFVRTSHRMYVWILTHLWAFMGPRCPPI